MATPTYIAKRNGDHYEIVDKDLVDKMAGFGLLAAGVGLELRALRRHGLRRMFYGLMGGYFLYLAAGRRSPGSNTKTRKRDRRTSQRGPSYAREGDKIRQQPEDSLQEASMESFPASDAPAHTPAKE